MLIQTAYFMNAPTCKLRAIVTRRYVLPIDEDKKNYHSLVCGSSVYKMSRSGDLYKKLNKGYKFRDEKPASERKVSSDKEKAEFRKKRLMDRIFALYNSDLAEQYFNFITLTFPQGVKNDDRVTILNTFLTRMRQYYPNFTYIWVREKHKSGLYHYHCFCCCYTDIKTMQALWIETIYNKTKLYATKRSIDLEVIDPANHGKCVQYIAKYVGKGDFTSEGRSWACSQLVSRLFCSSVIDWDSARGMINENEPRFVPDTEIVYFQLNENFRFHKCKVLIRANKLVRLEYERERARMTKKVLNRMAVDTDYWLNARERQQTALALE
jgi:hypothetical protein